MSFPCHHASCCVSLNGLSFIEGLLRHRFANRSILSVNDVLVLSVSDVLALEVIKSATQWRELKKDLNMLFFWHAAHGSGRRSAL